MIVSCTAQLSSSVLNSNKSSVRFALYNEIVKGRGFNSHSVQFFLNLFFLACSNEGQSGAVSLRALHSRLRSTRERIILCTFLIRTVPLSVLGKVYPLRLLLILCGLLDCSD